MDDVIIYLGKACGGGGGCSPIPPLFEDIEMKLSELATQLTAIDAKLTEASAEIVAKIDELQAALADVDLPAEASALIDDITAKATDLANIVPDPA